MKRVRLDIGAFNASPGERGSFMFFLYREGMDKCLPVSLSPPDMHALLSNFKKISEGGASSHGLLFSLLQDIKVELLEITIVKENDSIGFMTKLLFFDGDKEIIKDASFTDGIILAKLFSCPIYISEGLFNRYSTDNIDVLSVESVDKEPYIEKLRKELKEAISCEDYEKAAILSKKITKFENI